MTSLHPTTRRRALRAAGATVAALVGTGCAGPAGRRLTVTPAPVPPTETAPATGTPTPTATPLPKGVARVALVDFAFEPGTDAPLVVPAGTTVRFVWVTELHNLRVDAAPAGSTWQGHEPIEAAGFVHEHTFEAPGRYAFHCGPHEALGMVGSIVVERAGDVDGRPGSGRRPIPAASAYDPRPNGR